MKKIIALLLSLILALSCAVPAFAASPAAPTVTKKVTPPKIDTEYPMVVIRGMDFYTLKYKAGTKYEEEVFKGVDAKSILSTLGKAILEGVKHWDIHAFGDVVIDYAKDIIGRMACDENGDSKYDVSIEQYTRSMASYPEFSGDLGSPSEIGILHRAVDLYGAKKVYYYNYDYRLDPIMHAKRINKLINTALQENNKKQVNVISASMGGILMLHYLNKFGSDKIHRAIFLSSTFMGTYVSTDLLQGKVTLDSENLYDLVLQVLDSDKKALVGLIKALHAVGAFKLVAKLGTWLISKLKDQVYDEFLRDTFGTMPAIWAVTQPEEIDACLQYMFGGREKKYAGLIEKIRKYKSVALHREKILQSCVDNGMELAVIASYDRAAVPLYERANGQSDGVLDSPLMLGKATMAVRHQTLGSDYPVKNRRYISPDNIIDMSTALFPEYTWAIKDAPHVPTDYGSDINNMLFWIMNRKTMPTVRSNARYPQFMQSSSDLELRPFE